MPRWASRLTLTVTDLRVERLQDISEADAEAEGVGSVESHMPGTKSVTCVQSFQKLWDGLNANRGFGWQVNPWVAAYTFTVHPQNSDAEAG
ncbi:p14 [Rhodobacteraceae bacterium KLH11]|nr:p14 [Rhodobacteraceae bacterium KLH11]